ncbi:hypothetical protein MIND_01154300 [Mycena indigotica]|uniref:Peptidase metallopeptidase domain-containing protein n=1 Tax=Mycena indigotica TaxID=2126181 RepID=A0A8H6S764_9AGAR|nr:uncharacterized protein MIND_01154300 [Mycena indigotica]KAF7292570.1 hypothetical protein MIND_01154300 [Mycena indigotica]
MATQAPIVNSDSVSSPASSAANGPTLATIPASTIADATNSASTPVTNVAGAPTETSAAAPSTSVATAPIVSSSTETTNSTTPPISTSTSTAEQTSTPNNAAASTTSSDAPTSGTGAVTESTTPGNNVSPTAAPDQPVPCVPPPASNAGSVTPIASGSTTGTTAPTAVPSAQKTTPAVAGPFKPNQPILTATPVTPATINDVTCTINLPEDELRAPFSLERAICATQGPTALIARSLGQKLQQFWNNGQQITYSFISGDDDIRSKVSVVALHLLNFVNVTFVQVPQDGMVRISFDESVGSWSYVGTACLKVQAPRATMNISALEASQTLEVQEQMLVTHLFLHVLGLYHEHAGPKNGPTLNPELVYSYYKYTMGWDRALVQRHILDVYNATSLTNYAAPNAVSIMRYFMPAGLNTDPSVAGPTISEGQITPGDVDTMYLTLVYPPAPPWDPTIPQTMLQELGVDAATVAAYLAASAAGNVQQMRAVVTAWMATQRTIAL